MRIVGMTVAAGLELFEPDESVGRLHLTLDSLSAFCALHLLCNTEHTPAVQRGYSLLANQGQFGDSLRSKSDARQINEALCKLLCHNLCVTPELRNTLSCALAPC